ncbi:sphingomyelin synthetase, partial [Spraguea lophii 42_110]
LKRKMIQNILDYYKITKKSTLAILQIFFCMVLILIGCNIFSNIASHWSLDNNKYEPLPDLFFETFGYYYSFVIIDSSMYILLAITIILIFTNRDALQISFRLICCISIGYFIRMTTLAVTNLPDPNKECFKVDKSSILSEFNFSRCGDNIYSGHTLICMFLAFTCTSYKYFNNFYYNIIMNVIVWLLAMTSIIFLLLGRIHYTVDVVLSIYISIGIWILYQNWYSKMISKLNIFGENDNELTEVNIT